MDVQAIRKSYGEYVEAARKLSTEWYGKEGEMPTDVADKISAYLGKADEFKAKLMLAERLHASESELREPAMQPLAWRDAGPSEGDVPTDRHAWRSIEVKNMFGEMLTVRYNMPRFMDQEKKAKAYASAYEAYLLSDRYSELGPQDRKILTEGQDTSGGFLIPPDFMAMVIKKMMSITQMRSVASLSTTVRDAQSWPKINYATDDIYTSGVRMSWSGEAPAVGTAIRVTDPTSGLYTIPVHTALASLPIVNDLIDDNGVDLYGLLATLFGEAFALGEDSAFVVGSGVGQPTGILTEAGGNGPATYQTSGTNAVTGDDLINLFYKVPVQYRVQGKWMMSSSSMANVELLKDGQNRYLVSSLLQSSLATPQLDTLKGKAVLVDEFMPSIASGNNPIIFGDLSGYLILDRVGLTIQRLTEVLAEVNQTLFLARKRVGGYCIRPWELRILNIK